ncbi:isochorismatase [Floricoccus tropicus]|uniref:Isochorismatase n=1 Tax=Floricoccus tropicus TaxID=1859473 RepID=A0A1E8GMT5_9LACT|nr:cysteine hydrolase family protein [Floricoccus tropicus]OFI49564.1 isochorismatase [Floricoccus tropicus]
MKQALIIIDVQNDYFKNGKMELNNTENALIIINKLERKFYEANLPVIYIRHIKNDLKADFFAKNSHGSELEERLLLNHSSIIIEKQFPNSFYKTKLLSTLKKLKVEQVIICGMMTHMCVDSTTRASNELGLKPILIADGTATKDLYFDEELISSKYVQLSFLASLKNFAKVITYDEFNE